MCNISVIKQIAHLMLIMNDLVIIVSKSRNMTIIEDLKVKYQSICGVVSMIWPQRILNVLNTIQLWSWTESTLMSQYPFLLWLVSFHSPTSQIQLPFPRSQLGRTQLKACGGPLHHPILSSHQISRLWRHLARGSGPSPWHLHQGGRAATGTLSFRHRASPPGGLSPFREGYNAPVSQGGSGGARGAASQRSSAAAKRWHRPLAIYLHHPVNLIGIQWLDKWIGIMGQYTWHMWGSLEK